MRVCSPGKMAQDTKELILMTKKKVSGDFSGKKS